MFQVAKICSEAIANAIQITGELEMAVGSVWTMICMAPVVVCILLLL